MIEQIKRFKFVENVHVAFVFYTVNKKEHMKYVNWPKMVVNAAVIALDVFFSIQFLFAVYGLYGAIRRLHQNGQNLQRTK